MSDWQIREPQLHQLNTFLQRADDVIIYNCVTRTAQESKLFPIMPYLMLCFFDAYYRYPDLIREASAHITPEDCGHRAREVTTNLGKLTAWGILNFYLNGRASLVKMGLLRPEDNLEDLWTVCDWWQRFSRAYHRNGGHAWTYDAGDMAQEHSERVLQVLEADAYAADDRLRDAAAKFIATGTQYAFLAHCESRIGLQASGPYRLGERLLLHTRDFMNLAECDFSWLDGVAEDVPYNNLTLTLVTDDVAIEINDYGTMYPHPEDYQSRIVGVGLHTSDFLIDRYEPVGMDSARDLTDTLEALTATLAKATRRLYRRFSEMNFRQMTDAGMYTYFQVASDISHMAGTYRQDQWEFVDHRAERFRALHNEEYALDAYLDNFAIMDGLQGSASEYYLHPIHYGIWRRNRDGRGALPNPGRNAFPVPARVLLDHDYPRRVNPRGLADCAGESSLPAKSRPYMTSRGRLSEEEMNALASEFFSPLFSEPWVHYDEQHVKWHWRDDDVDVLYRYVQERSRLLAGQGAGLLREDLDRLRKEAGQPAWRDLASTAGG